MSLLTQLGSDMGRRWDYTYLGFPGGSVVKSLSVNTGDTGFIQGREDPREEEMGTRSSILAWKSPGWRSLAA